MLLTLVRHGECLAQCNPQYFTDPDSALSPLGIEQATAAAQQLATEQITHIISSPLIRALTTADSIAESCGSPHIHVWTELREAFLMDIYNGIPRSQLQAQFPRAVLPNSITEDGWTYGDVDYDAFWLRCQDVIARVRQQHTSQDHVVLVAHGGCLNNVLHSLLGIRQSAPMWFELANGSISRVRLVADPQAERTDWDLYPPVAAEVKNISDVAHLVHLQTETG